MNISIIVPAHNEEKNIRILYDQIVDSIQKSKIDDFEIIFVDDGSTDNTFEEMRKLDAKIIKFQHNFGKSAGLDAAFELACKDIVITIDADLQDDPYEIPRLIQKLGHYDMVSGWKQRRKDPLSKIVPSKIFNTLARILTGLKIHDFNCGFKAYKKKVIKNIKLYGEMHRYIPALAAMKGYKVGEVKVRHHQRRFGKSKYGFNRLFKGVFDLITVTFFRRYSTSPLYFFGTLGGISFMLGIVGGLYILYQKMIGRMVSNRPIVILVMLLLIIGIQFTSLGLLAELIIREKKEKTYVIDKVIK